MQCHAAKMGGWVGQTFALAKPTHSDSASVGKKSRRIRRSKEDRKALVLSFIKRYQSSNNGNFPSLNLTHKEVGGSFYTVREIVREIIQENRVLGPAKLTGDEQEVDLFHEQYPLGSISIACQSHSSLCLNEIHAVSNDHQSISEELETTVNGKLSGQLWDNIGNGKIACQQLDNTVNGKTDSEQLGNTVNGEVNIQQPTRVDSERYFDSMVVDKEFNDDDLDKLSVEVNSDEVYTDTRITQTFKPDPVEDIIEISTPIATDVVVETFPIIFASEMTENMDGRSAETGSLEVQHETQKVKVKPELGESDSNEISVEQQGDQFYETLSSSNAKDSRSTVEDKDLQADVTLQITNKDLVVAGMENNVHREDSNDERSKQGESFLHQSAATISKSDNQYGTAEEGKSSTLNRTKLESWQGSSKTAETETNPVLAIVKAFITAFVRFWTE